MVVLGGGAVSYERGAPAGGMSLPRHPGRDVTTWLTVRPDTRSVGIGAIVSTFQVIRKFKDPKHWIRIVRVGAAKTL